MTEQTAATPSKKWPEDAEYAGFMARSIVAVIDSIVILMPIGIIMGSVFYMMWGDGVRNDTLALQIQAELDSGNTEGVSRLLVESGFVAQWLTENLSITIAGAVVTILFWYFFSATPGKIWLGMKIVDADTGMPPTKGQSIVRYLGYFISTFAVMLGFLWIMWDKRAQGWHDKIANTVVVYKNSLPPELEGLTRKRLEDEEG